MEIRNGSSPNNTLGIENLFTESNRLWIEGDAGSGKTTLLQWLAVNSAFNNHSILKDLQDTIPFVVELRKQNTQRLSIKDAVNTIMYDCDVEMPENWLSDNLNSGKAIILIDGFDEVKAEDREEVQNWIDELTVKYPKARIIVTSRPEIGNAINRSFAKMRLLPMSREKMAIFLDYWHRAVLVDRLGINKNEATQYKNKLIIKVDNSDSVRKMMTNPLLCAMVCALHYKNGAVMSNERNELYEDCCKMLFGSRDAERDINAFEHITLSYEEKKSILAQVAYWMMKNNLIIANKEQIISCIERSLKAMRRTSQERSADELFQYFMERSGILRAPEEGKVDFIHKSFQEYLAAYEIHNQDDWGFITSKAYDINWYETLILSMGFASMPNARFVIETILGDGENSRDIVIAAACATNANRLDYDLRNHLNQKIESILPPKTQEESESIARAEEFVIPYLSNQDGMTSAERYFSLNALRMIGTVQALTVAGTYLHSNVEMRILHLLDDMLKHYTTHEIKQSRFLEVLAAYVSEVSKNTKMYIGETLLMNAEQCDFYNLFNECEELTIFGYGNRISKEIIKSFTNVKRLALNGEFSDISSIKKITNQLNTLSLNDSSGMFDFYRLNFYSFLKLERFYYQSTENIYFNGDDCDAISHVKELGIFLYNPNSHLEFDGFDQFHNLTTVWLYHDVLLEFKVEEIFEKNEDINELFLIFPDYTDMRHIIEMRKQLQTYKDIVVKTKYYSTCFKNETESFFDKDRIFKSVLVE